MKCLKAMIGKAAVLFLLLCPMTAWGQSDVDKQDPRGVYKLMTITSYGEERPSPFDQYKICTDSISLTVVVEGDGAFMIVRNDRDILNYTGDVTEGDTDTRVRVYDSNEQEFLLKWWPSPVPLFRRHRGGRRLLRCFCRKVQKGEPRFSSFLPRFLYTRFPRQPPQPNPHRPLQ